MVWPFQPPFKGNIRSKERIFDDCRITTPRYLTRSRPNSTRSFMFLMILKHLVPFPLLPRLEPPHLDWYPILQVCEDPTFYRVVG